ncbi:asparagine synthase (glutamine-hydrolyzing) [Saccharospirillum alexandrii]|uniref:asparagine synthase (glutamine-hydrolyzing) n=1 Tax=Saccharospirillum alexandrii TaxID=2448477 RepID=UPI000FD8537E|nr:asparagine synthase (glutamine-hydrolyzing) [Saccharospirillum alexandrii]
MCGINGIVDLSKQIDEVSSQSNLLQLNEMNESILYRGPDSEGTFESSNKRVYLGHRRLSIIDISVLGNQPMTSKNENYVIVFNGEIYNFIELRRELEERGVNCQSTSDTEVLLELIAYVGVEKALEKIIGMFAFALYDKVRDVLHLARDRLGEKPLYYGRVGNRFAFSSELKGIEVPFNKSMTVSKETASLFFTYGYFPGESTIFNEVYKLEPGKILTFNLTTEIISKKSYDKKEAPQADSSKLPHSELVNKFDLILQKVISDQMVSDVSLGSFLSGGIDSSLVTSIMSSISNRQIETFTIGFDDKQFDESRKAHDIAKHLGAISNIIEISERDLLGLVDTIVLHLDEPFANASAIPSFLLSKFTKNKVSVCLSGDGGDELFIGYNRYSKAKRLFELASSQPKYMKQSMGAVIRVLQSLPVDSVLNKLAEYSNQRLGVNYESKIKKLKIINESISAESLYRKLISYSDVRLTVFDSVSSKTLYDRSSFDFDSDFIKSAAEWDVKYYLPGDCLYKTDRTAMANSLEVRVPLLDSRITSFANSLSIEQKLHNKTEKAILKDTLSKYVPPRLFNRPKMGFTVPLGKWITGPLSNDIKRYLSFENITAVGILDYEVVSNMVSKSQRGSRVYDNAIWACYVFQKWMISRGYLYA